MGNAAVAFVTLFLSLVMGPQTVEVAVTGPVATVEIRIDGETVEVISGEPWKRLCDLGPLRPLVLEAVAFDADGNERARARQLVNLPRPAVESSFVLERGTDGRPRSAHLIWETALGLSPVSVDLTLDGLPIEADDLSSIPLPDSDPRSVHFLSARLGFEDGLTSHAEIRYGGLWGGETSTALTAVPVLCVAGKRRLKPGDLEGFFVARGDVARVVAVEKSPPALTIVADSAADATLQEIQKRRLRMRPYTDRASGSTPEQKDAYALRKLTDLDSTSGGLWMVSTVPRTSILDRGPLDLFPMTTQLSLFKDGIMWLLCHPEVLPRARGPQQIADAVAVAGLFAAHSASPRAVLLVLGSDTDHASESRPEQVRGYLRTMNVPLFVWATAPGSHVEAWGECEEVTSPSAANTAMIRVEKHLKRQRVVWLDGAYLPNEIELSPEAEGLELAR